MVMVAAMREYVLRMLTDVQGLKALLVDSETLAMVSLALTQTEILHKDVFLVEKIDCKSREPMPHLKAVAFIRPTADNINHLKRHLHSPRFGEYNLFFSNVIGNTLIHVLADADTHEVVTQLQEYFGDYYALDSYHFTLHVPNNHYSYVSATVDLQHTQRICDRSVEALLAVFLSLKRRPVIRYQRGSEMARRIAHETGRIMYEAEKPLFDFRRTDAMPLLLVIDRRDDPVTPLLQQWTYQAMVHELIGIDNNKVDLRSVVGISDDQKEVVLSAEQDDFFRKNMYENFGDVGVAIGKLVDELQKKDRRNRGMKSLEEMAALLETYPEYRRQSSSVAKHVAIMSELQERVESRKLMAVSEVEQELACSSAQQAAFEAVMTHLSSDVIHDVDKLRLVMLYALRYEKEAPRLFAQMMNKLSTVPSRFRHGLVYTLLRLCGAQSRVSDLYGSKDLINMVARNVKRGLTGVENVYTQHQPLLTQTIDAACKGKLSENDYPFYGMTQQLRSLEIVVFVVGGTTYEEARAVALFNAANTGTRVVLGGTALLSSNKFVEDMEKLYELESTSGLD